MWKEGRKVELNGTRYHIQQCSSTEQNKVCRTCAAVNMMPPCIARNNYPESTESFSVNECRKNCPTGCYPRKI